MKLLPILAGTLMREAHAVCNSGDPIIRVTCHDDLMVQLQGMKSLKKSCEKGETVLKN